MKIISQKHNLLLLMIYVVIASSQTLFAQSAFKAGTGSPRFGSDGPKFNSGSPRFGRRR